MRCIALIGIIGVLSPAMVQAADLDRTLRLGGWIAQAIEFNNARAGTSVATVRPDRPMLGNGTDVRFGDLELALQLGWEDEKRPVGAFAQPELGYKPGKGFGVDLRELYLHGGDVVRVEAGRFIVPIGVEPVNLPEMATVTHGLVYENLVPTTLTGAKVRWNASEFVNLQVYMGGPWDRVEFLAAEGLNVGGRLGGVFGDVGTMGLSVLWGDSDDTPNKFLPRVALDLDGALFVLDGDLMLAFEANLNVIKKETVREFFLLNPFGLMLAWDWQYSDWGHAGMRFDLVADDAANGIAGLWYLNNGEAIMETAYTFVGGFVVADVFEIRSEVRLDHANMDIFETTKDASSKNVVRASVAVLYEF